MTIQLDHIMVPSRDKVAAARLLGELLDVPWSVTLHANDIFANQIWFVNCSGSQSFEAIPAS